MEKRPSQIITDFLFRGKRTDNGEWVEGNYITDEQEPFRAYIGYLFGVDDDGMVHDTDVVEVNSETVCRCTGLTDKNGRKIFEGDILSAYFDDNHPEDITYVQITWNGFSWCMRESTEDDVMSEFDCNTFEVCGNIFDNPELMEGGAG